ncbi:MAG: hypothetical protein RhofKO_13020 [Rhodothermales bacterium]
MSETMYLRPYQPADAPAAAEVASAAIRETGAEAYQPDQLAAWGAWPDDVDAFAELLGEGETWIAEHEGQIVAFGQRFPADHINLLYTHPSVNRQGIAGRLYAKLETHALEEGIATLTAKASHLSRPFFAKHGWVLDESEVVEREGVRIERFSMHKALSTPLRKEKLVTT